MQEERDMNASTSLAARLVAILLAAGAMSEPARAEASVGPSMYETGQGYVTAALDTAGEYWTNAVVAIGRWMPGMSSRGMLTHQLQAESEKSELDFTNMMSAAGYAVKSLKMGVGVLPKFSFSFGQKREMSSVDYDYIQRLLRKHKQSRSSPKAMAERMIIQTVLDIQRFPEYDLAKVDVTMLPVPNVEFTAEPKSATLDSETSYVVRRIDNLNRLLEQMGAQ
jgi:hypothetical protein